MAINPGNSALSTDVHPIHEHHEVLRKEGYKPSYSARIDGSRINSYSHPSKPNVEITSSPKEKNPIFHETVESGYQEIGHPGRTPKQLSKNISRVSRLNNRENDF